MNEFLHPSINHTLQQTLHQTLAWVQNSPPLFNRLTNPLCLDHPLPAGIKPVIPDTGQLDSLASLVSKKGNPLLGIFYETLWQFLLSQLPEIHILASNLQVRGQKNGQPATLGEYDLLYQFRHQRIHRELAVKFYLGIPGADKGSKSSPWRHWIGPGLKDRLDRKMDRLLHHQATLSDTEEGQEALIKQGVELPVDKEILIQGRLFYPLYPLATAEAQSIPLIELFHPSLELKPNKSIEQQFQPQQFQPQQCPPELCNPGHLRGYWLTQSQFLHNSNPDSSGLIYQVPDKIQWLNKQPDSTSLNHSELMPQLKQQRQPVYIRAIVHKLQNQVHLFIVPDDWPEKAAAVSHQ